MTMRNLEKAHFLSSLSFRVKKVRWQLVRVIAGEKKGHPLKAVPGSSTRPTSDKVKESIFNMIGPFFDGGVALDLFGGSGGLGIEALSRGIQRVIFIDQDKKAIETIKSNVEHCQFNDDVEIYRNDALRALRVLIKREIEFSMIFIDPPYANDHIPAILAMINDHRLLAKDGTIICEYKSGQPLPERVGTLVNVRTEQYGDTAVSIFQNEEKS